MSGFDRNKLPAPEAAEARQVALPDPDEFVEQMARVRKKRAQPEKDES